MSHRYISKKRSFCTEVSIGLFLKLRNPAVKLKVEQKSQKHEPALKTKRKYTSGTWYGWFKSVFCMALHGAALLVIIIKHVSFRLHRFYLSFPLGLAPAQTFLKTRGIKSIWQPSISFTWNAGQGFFSDKWNFSNSHL